MRRLSIVIACLLGSGTAFPVSFYAQHPASTAPQAADAAANPRKVINEFLDAAFNAYIDEDYERAILNFQKILQIDPRDKTAIGGLQQSQGKLKNKYEERVRRQKGKVKFARTLIKNEKWVDAADILMGVIDSVPNHQEAQELMKDILEAVSRHEAVIPAGAPEHLIYQGIRLYMNKRYSEAVLRWKEAEILLPDDVRIMVYLEKASDMLAKSEQYEMMISGRNRARAAIEAGNYEEAVALWKRISELDPEDDEAKKQLAEAQELLAAKNRQSRIETHYDKGLALFLEDKLSESLREWLSILEIDRDNEVARDYVQRIKRKGVSAAKAAPARSAQPAQPARAADPASPGAAPSPDMERGMALYKQGDYAGSVEAFKKRLDADPADKQAMEWLEKVSIEQNEKAHALYKQGLVSYSEGKIDEAVHSWQEALEIAPTHAATLRVVNKVRKSAP